MSEIKKYSRMGEELMVYGGNSSQTATTMQQMMDFMKQEADTVGDVVDSMLWQPSTTVRIGQVVFSANLPAGYVAIATTGGQTGDVEPIWSTDYATFSDGTVVWKLETLTGKLSASDGVADNSLGVSDGTNRTTVGSGGLELYHATPYIDFHFNKDSNVDYTARIVESKKGTINILDNLTVGGYDVSTITSIGEGYIRYTNGLQICWGRCLNNGENPTFLYPAPFAGTPNTIVSIDSTSALEYANNYNIAILNNSWNSFWAKAYSIPEHTATNDGIEFSYIAIGRWY